MGPLTLNRMRVSPRCFFLLEFKKLERRFAAVLYIHVISLRYMYDCRSKYVRVLREKGSCGIGAVIETLNS